MDQPTGYRTTLPRAALCPREGQKKLASYRRAVETDVARTFAAERRRLNAAQQMPLLLPCAVAEPPPRPALPAPKSHDTADRITVIGSVCAGLVVLVLGLMGLLPGAGA